MHAETGAPLPDLLSLPVDAVDALRLLRRSAAGAEPTGPDPAAESLAAMAEVWKKAR